MKNLLCLLPLVIIFIVADLSFALADTYVKVKIESMAMDTVDNDLYINVIEEVSNNAIYMICDEDSPLVPLIVLAYQTQSVCRFHGYMEGGYLRPEIIVLRRSDLTTDSDVKNLIINVKTDLVNEINFVKTRVQNIYYWVYWLYRKLLFGY